MIVVFDFDKTLTNKDTLLGFFLECSTKDFSLLVKLTIYAMLMLFNKLKITTNDRFKKIAVKIFLKGLKKDYFLKCANLYSKKIKFNHVYYDRYLKYDEPFIISASFFEYLSPLFPKTNLICSELEYSNERINALKTNCYGFKKCKALKRIGITHIDEFYTDSLSDLPLAKISHSIFLVRGQQIIKCRDLLHFIKIAKK